MRFTKMEGIGNDYVYINCFEEDVGDPAELSRRMSRYHFGCGSDGLILILPSDKADFRMRMFNSDGSESGMCGNGVRCIAKYVRDRGLIDKDEITLETGDGIKTLRCRTENGSVASVTVDMGEPKLRARDIPCALSGDRVIGHTLTALGNAYSATLVSMGNPHAVIFVDDPLSAPVTAVGPLLEKDPVFPERANIEFARVIDRRHINMRVWERGTGETMACGTGACAVMVAARLSGLIEREAYVRLPGGELTVEWGGEGESVLMTGPARFVYDGVWLGDKD